MAHVDDRPHPGRSLLILSLAALSFALAQTLIVPAIVDLADALDTDAAGIAWTFSGYLVSAAVFTPVMGRLGDMFGKRRLLVISLVIFAAGSAVSALGSTLLIVVAGRVIQGAGGGIFPLCFGIVRDEFPRERVRSSIGLISATVGIGGGLGLIVGGLIIDHASYHWIFWLGTAGALIAAVAAQLLIPESPERAPGRVDLRGAAVLAVGLVMPLIAISEANTWGWTSTRTIGLIVAGLVVLVLWVRLEQRTEEPLADIATLRSPPVLMTNIATVLTGFGMFGSFILIPQLVEAPSEAGYGFGASATRAGLLILPGSLAMLAAGPLSGHLGNRFGGKIPLAAGCAMTAVGLVLMGVAHGSELEVVIFSLIMFFGIGLAFAAMPNLIIDAVPSGKTGEATGFNALVRSVGASLGSQVSAAILAGSIVAGGFPTDESFRTAFLVSAVVALIAAITAMRIPRVHGPHNPHATDAEEIGAVAGVR